jgi:hypothetical protein
MYGPRDVVDVSWALLLVFLAVCRRLRLLHMVLVCRSWAVLVPIAVPLSSLSLSSPRRT